MSELTAQCDSLKARIRELEEDLARKTQLVETWKCEAENTRGQLEQQCNYKMDALKDITGIAELLGIDVAKSDNTPRDIREAIVMLKNKWDQDELNRNRYIEFIRKISALHGGIPMAEYRLPCVLAAVKERIRMNLDLQARCNEVTTKCLEHTQTLQCVTNALEDAMGYERKDVPLTRGQMISRISHLGECRKQNANNTVGKGTHIQPVPEHCDRITYKGDTFMIMSIQGIHQENKAYCMKYDELQAAAKAALLAAGLRLDSGLNTKHEEILNALTRLSEAVVADTVDARIEALEKDCYAAESMAGCLCTEQCPWNRVKWVLNQLACKVRRLDVENKKTEKIREAVKTLKDLL